uniref:Uncharacterized protein n=1 Tax=Schistocephalus solidus TaxID=70667 RepID=A0A0X3NHB2_SCHSO
MGSSAVPKLHAISTTARERERERETRPLELLVVVMDGVNFTTFLLDGSAQQYNLFFNIAKSSALVPHIELFVLGSLDKSLGYFLNFQQALSCTHTRPFYPRCDCAFPRMLGRCTVQQLSVGFHAGEHGAIPS